MYYQLLCVMFRYQGYHIWTHMMVSTVDQDWLPPTMLFCTCPAGTVLETAQVLVYST